MDRRCRAERRGTGRPDCLERSARGLRVGAVLADGRVRVRAHRAASAFDSCRDGVAGAGRGDALYGARPFLSHSHLLPDDGHRDIGTGKSSLVTRALADLVSTHLGADRRDREDDEAAPAEATTRSTGRVAGGADRVRRLVEVDQRSIGRTPRSNLATYTGRFDHIRARFAATPTARRLRWTAARFSFNLVARRCTTCERDGYVSVELLFRQTVYAPCPTCGGERCNRETLAIRLNGTTIADVLALTVADAAFFFAAERRIVRPLTLLADIGIGYLRLGQPATELSGGEALRIKLVTELQKSRRGDTLYIRDEPTTGLHPADVDLLMLQLRALVDAGNTLVVVEHDMRIVAQGDWVVDMGPDGGEKGCWIIATGTPRDVAVARGSVTASCLRPCVML